MRALKHIKRAVSIIALGFIKQGCSADFDESIYLAVLQQCDDALVDFFGVLDNAPIEYRQNLLEPTPRFDFMYETSRLLHIEYRSEDAAIINRAGYKYRDSCGGTGILETSAGKFTDEFFRDRISFLPHVDGEFDGSYVVRVEDGKFLIYFQTPNKAVRK